MPSRIVKLPSANVGVTTLATDIGELLQATLTIPSKDMVSLVRNYIIGRSPLASNELNLFTIKGGITSDKYAIAMLNRAKHLWSSRKDGCQFSPKGRIGSERAEFELQPIEYDGVQCPDEFFGSEWETMFGTGDPFEMLKTQQSQTIFVGETLVVLDAGAIVLCSEFCERAFPLLELASQQLFVGGNLSLDYCIGLNINILGFLLFKCSLE